jgi:hypothetical protein
MCCQTNNAEEHWNLNRAKIVGDNSGRLRVVIGRDGGTIHAHVAGDGGLPSASSSVFIFPAAVQSESELATSIVNGFADGNGTYVAAGLAPGRYYVVATYDPPPGIILFSREEVFVLEKSPEALAQLLSARSRAQLVTLGAGAIIQVNLAPKPLD